jgi:catechol 2,3-dioxygenase-like lactoylglutathione lyase family enzyme
VARALSASFITGIHHAGITVSDLDRSIDFYTGVLGLELLTEPSERRCSAHLDQMVEISGAEMRGVLLRVGNTAVELHEYSAPESPNDEPLPANALGAQHVAFEVEDLAAEMDRIAALGIGFATPINVIDGGPFTGIRAVFLHDPDGIRIELVQVAYWDADARREGIENYLRGRAAQVPSRVDTNDRSI